MGTRRQLLGLACRAVAASAALPLAAQVIEFESGGLHYKTLTRNGVTVMFAPLPLHVREYSVIQVAVSNGSTRSWIFKPQDMKFTRPDGIETPGSEARVVVGEFMKHGGREDVYKLVSSYENALYGMQKVRSTNGYEMRRQSAMADQVNAKWKAAATASAIVFVNVKLKPGESTDGAVFFPNNGKPLGEGKLVIEGGGSVFEYEVTPSQ